MLFNSSRFCCRALTEQLSAAESAGCKNDLKKKDENERPLRLYLELNTGPLGANTDIHVDVNDVM